MSGSNSFVFSAKRRGSNTPVVCKFFSDQDSYRREMKFFERVHTGDFVPGDTSTSHHITSQHNTTPATNATCVAGYINAAGVNYCTGLTEPAVMLKSVQHHSYLMFLHCSALSSSCVH